MKDSGYPNRFYYGGGKEIKLNSSERFNLGKFGAELKLSCGGVWFLGRTFAYCIEYAADSYFHLSNMIEFTKQNCSKWFELKRHLFLYKHTIHTIKSQVEFLKQGE